MNIRIYQVNLNRDENSVEFQGLETADRQREIDSEKYDCVYSGEVDCNDLEDVFHKFNIDRPDGYKGRSLSVSDVIEVIDAAQVESGFYFCDNIGFKSVLFDPELAKPYKDERIKVLMVEPGKKAYEKVIGTSLDDLYAALNCDCIQTFYPCSDRDLVVIVCDDEGKINGSRPNRAIYGDDGKIMDIIFGEFFICDCSTSSFKSMPDDMMQKYKKQFLLPERFACINGEVLAIKYDPSREEAR